MDETTKYFRYAQPFPRYGWLALLLCLFAWISSWLHIEPFGRYMFFPLWLGYILFMDALVFVRHGTSLLTRMRWRFSLLFVASSFFWWLFEVLNIPVGNWHYILDQPYSPWLYAVLASLNFSTVLPAVFETTEFLFTFKLLRPRLSPYEPGPRLSIPAFLGLEVLGLFCFVLPWIFPRYCFGLIWLSLIFLLDPLNNVLGRKSALAHLMVRDWHFFIVPLGALFCGFFWEMWNYFSLPKWYYTIPYVGFLKVFEMPLLGYLGYLPFALELFALYQFVLWTTGQKEDFLII
ncbi:hypothetical protein KDA_15640 [Dictyobacter alpinus]|uniref:Lycopene cyclase domain-containing protein n=1 Tax=Dictyobacter alpinus TaxID=2014873 RepID=A0A402B403_9CHLR|nr:hypothetical protein [Dictyobacter alpinus]GCE26080.1 hypothetical protein KDA_15640 [Dictyobacter alpinus]